jgi:hypothetical protein
MGVIVEASLLVRKHSTCRTVMAYTPCSRLDSAEAARIVRERRAACDNMFVIMHPGCDQIYTEQRWLVPGKTRIIPGVPDTKLFLVGTPKSYCFQRGKPLHPVFAGIMALNRFLAIDVHHRRYRFTNTYRAVTQQENRLDFSYFEFDVSRLDQVVSGCWEFAAEYERRTGFMPGGFAMYWVSRPGGRVAGSYTGAKGTSFMLDPIHNDPTSAEWHAFNEAYTRWAVGMHGANVSLTQTKALTSASEGLGGALPASMARERFLTPFFKPFVVSDRMFEAQVSYARPAGDDHPRKRELLARVEELVMEAEAKADRKAVAAVAAQRRALRRAAAGAGGGGGAFARASRLLSNWGLLSTMEKHDDESDDGAPMTPSPKKQSADVVAVDKKHA